MLLGAIAIYARGGGPLRIRCRLRIWGCLHFWSHIPIWDLLVVVVVYNVFIFGLIIIVMVVFILIINSFDKHNHLGGSWWR